MKKGLTLMRKGLTLIELVFVIVVLAIVVTIGTEIIFQTYKSYLVERAVYRASIQTDTAGSQIVNRLSASVPGTIIARKPSGVFMGIADDPPVDYEILQWVGVAEDSFTSRTNTSINPGWTGFIDLDDSTKDKLTTSGSDLNLADTVIKNVSGGNRKVKDSAIFFPEQYNVFNIGYSGGVSDGISKAFSGTGDILTLVSLPAGTTRKVNEFYKMAWSSYAIVPVNFSNGTFDLELRYNFQPWNGESYDSAIPKREILITDVTTFKFIGTGSTFRFKLCKKEKAGPFEKIICKEKAVIR